MNVPPLEKVPEKGTYELVESEIVLKPQQPLSQESMARLREHAANLTAELDCQVLMVERGIDAEEHSDIAPLVKAIHEQTKAINALAESNMALVEMMADVDQVDDEEREPATYMDGTPK